MIRGSSARQQAELDAFVEAYELRRSADPAVDVATFLPAADHPLRLEVLSELIRIDLEYGWRNGSPRPLGDYQQRFPELFRDPGRLAAIAFEEYRLRRQLGERVTPAQYAQAWGICAEGWPTGDKPARGSAAAASIGYAASGAVHPERSPGGAILTAN